MQNYLDWIKKPGPTEIRTYPQFKTNPDPGSQLAPKLRSYEFHVSRAARDLYQFDDSLFSLHGNVVFANMHGVRVFADKINRNRDVVHYPEQAVRAGQLFAMGLIDEILHLVIQLYREEIDPKISSTVYTWVENRIGQEALEKTLQVFADEYPPILVYRRAQEVDAYLSSDTNGVPNREIVLEELLLLWLANANPAFSPYLELFNDANLRKQTEYKNILVEFKEFFSEQPGFGPDREDLVGLLRSPAIAVPHSLSGQLEYIRERWGYLLGKYLYRLLSSLDLIREEKKFGFLGAGPAQVYEFGHLDVEPERFSQDKDWMPRVVLMAKNIYVWLDQLSKQYQRPINRLDQIPDEELDRLQQWGFTGLWMIGLWERSSASRQIKNLMGNPDAVASAYSLLDYQIAADLGGDPAYENLRDRAWQRGVRVSSDMVPNHMGIDSKWMIEHPDWFLGLDYSPFPSYSFNGPDLSRNDNVGIFLEDHYYDRSDAAVVFKRRDHRTGQEKYIYHGNDGTSMPWNDTAQLNFLNPEVREAVIQTILHVARKFSIIRFDAAMTLARKHYQRLWFPEPGTGGAIPSRAEFGLSKAEFNRIMPVEFWREVVDRVAEEVPDTLLLAEAFWMMEGYFVRTLGMHRVYNSAFMNMLRDEENANYRTVLKKTLEFDPQIMKRFVNFMNNPDERTAVDQFGKDDKYFGICTLMATLPGLPMFGHGQIEGYTEKYGMEFRRAYWDEQPDQYLIERHQREIFPLLHRRYLFAEVEDFYLYDFFSSAGFVNEDVFAYSNRHGDERGLVIYHNKYADTSGWIRTAVASAVVERSTGDRVLVQKSLGEGLGLRAEAGVFTIFKDQRSGLEYIRPNTAIYEQGFYIELGAYSTQVFVDFREVEDDEWHQYSLLTSYLDGRGVPSIEEASREVVLRPIREPFHELVNPGMFRWLIENRLPEVDREVNPDLISEVDEKTTALYNQIQHYTGQEIDIEEVVTTIRDKLELILSLPVIYDAAGEELSKGAIAYLQDGINEQPAVWGGLCAWLFTHALGKTGFQGEFSSLSRSWVDEWLLGKILARTFQDLGLPEANAWYRVSLVKILISHQDWFNDLQPDRRKAYTVLETLLQDAEIHQFIQINRYQGTLWINKEALESLLWWLNVVAVVQNLTGETDEPKASGKYSRNETAYKILMKISKAAETSGYQLDQILDTLRN